MKYVKPGVQIYEIDMSIVQGDGNVITERGLAGKSGISGPTGKSGHAGTSSYYIDLGESGQVKKEDDYEDSNFEEWKEE